MLIVFQEKERIGSILMEYQRKKAVSMIHSRSLTVAVMSIPL